MLNKQILPISLNQGIDTKTDPKQVVAGKLITLENGIFKTAKEIRKRFGFSAIPNAIASGGNLTSGVNVAPFLNELTSLDGQNLYSYSSATQTNYNKGALPTTQISESTVVRNVFIQTSPDSSINGNFQAFAWNDTSGGGNIRYSIVDTVTGQTIVNNQRLTPNNTIPKVVAIGVYFVFFYYNNAKNSMFYKAFNTSTLTLGSEVTIGTDLDSTNHLFDATVINGSAYLTYGKTSSNIDVYSLSPTLVLSSVFTVTTGDSPTGAITIFGDATGNAWIAYSNSTAANVVVVNGALSSIILAKTVIYTQSNICNITGIVTGTTATVFMEVGTVNAQTVFNSTYTNFTTSITVTITGTVGSLALISDGIGLASKAFLYNGIYYVLCVFPTALQATYFVISQFGVVAAKISPALAGGESQRILPEANTVSSGVFQFATLIKDSEVAFKEIVPGALPVPGTPDISVGIGVQSSQITFTQSARPKSFLGQNLHYGGGILWMYDGSNVVEHSYNMYPEGVSYTPTLTGGGIGIGASTSTINQVQYSVIYEWTDNQGQLHRSAPSVPLTVPLGTTTPVTFTGNTTMNSAVVTSVSGTTGLMVGQVVTNTNFPNPTTILVISGTTVVMSNIATASSTGSTFSTKDIEQIQITVPNLRLTAKNNVTIVIYRTVNNGTIFYRLNDPSNPLFTGKLTDSTTYTDSAPDAVIIGNEQLYTTGGEVENIAAPAVSALTTYRNRMIYLSPENPYQWGYSKQVIQGFPVEFSSQLFVQNVDPKGGPLSAIAEMDDKLILFKNNSIFYVVGEGPSPSGLNNDFVDPQFVSSDTGCNNQASIVLTPVGVMFQSPKGIYLLGRSLGLSYIGAEVEAYNTQTVTSAILVSSLNQVRFTMNSGVILSYDYYFNQWSVFTNLNAADSALFQNQHTFISPLGVFSQENFSNFTDNGAFIGLKLVTSWFSFAGIQGYERIYKLLVLGDYKSPHTLNINIGYDFNPNTTTAITPIPVLSDPTVYQYRIFLPRQKCESAQFTFYDTQTAPYGEGLSLSSMLLEFGIKVGANKMSAARSYG